MKVCAVHADKHLLQFINTTARAHYSNGNRSGLPAADKAQFHQIIATGKRALRASYIWPYSTMELHNKMYIHIGSLQDSFEKKAVFK